MVRPWLHLTLASVCLAQAPSGRSERNFLLEVANDQATLATAPFRMTGKQWLTTALPLAGATALLIVTDARVSASVPDTPGLARVSKGISEAGALYTLGAGVAGTAIYGKLARQPEAVRTGALAARSLISSTILTYSLKFAGGRERPYDNAGEGRFWKARDSFPSGHSLTTWAVATTIARRRNCPRWLAITSYAAAAAVSLSRIGARKHFPGDVFAGSTLGFLVGSRMAHQP